MLRAVQNGGSGFAGSGHLAPANAAGQGWFVDATPQWDEEFAGAGSPVARFDLLSTVTHELGHLLGHADVDASLHGLDPMSGELSVGLRQMPSDGWSLNSLSSATSLDLSPLSSSKSPTPLAGLATAMNLRSLDRKLQPLATEREALFAHLDLTDWIVLASGGRESVEPANSAGRGRRKERSATHDIHDEVFAEWIGEEEDIGG